MSKERLKLYKVGERVWHGVQAIAILMLIVSSFAIVLPERFGDVKFAVAIRVHNILGFLLVVNAVAGLIYYLISGSIRHFLPERKGLVGSTLDQVRYYVRGIFLGHPHPFEKSAKRRLNPLQQITYLGIVNVLLPLQMATGLAMWSEQVLPGSVNFTGGLAVLNPIHTAGAWLFVTFLVVHVYLTTTGTTPVSNIKAMITGFEVVAAGHHTNGATTDE